MKSLDSSTEERQTNGRCTFTVPHATIDVDLFLAKMVTHATIEVYLFLAKMVSEWRGALTQKNRRKCAIFFFSFHVILVVYLGRVFSYLFFFNPVAVLFFCLQISFFGDRVLSSQNSGKKPRKKKIVHTSIVSRDVFNISFRYYYGDPLLTGLHHTRKKEPISIFSGELSHATTVFGWTSAHPLVRPANRT